MFKHDPTRLQSRMPKAEAKPPSSAPNGAGSVRPGDRASIQVGESKPAASIAPRNCSTDT